MAYVPLVDGATYQHSNGIKYRLTADDDKWWTWSVIDGIFKYSTRTEQTQYLLDLYCTQVVDGDNKEEA